MRRILVIIHSQGDRERLRSLIDRVPVGTRIEVKEARRTLPQNDRMWAMLTDIARQVVWYGYRLDPSDWKLLFLDALNREVRAVPAIDRKGFVNIGISSSDLGKGEMSDMIELMFKFGANHKVKFGDETDRSVSPSSGSADQAHS